MKRLPDGRAMLNVGCGVKMDVRWNNLDFSPYAWLAHRPRVGQALKLMGVLSAERFQRLQLVDPDILYWDLRRGIPFPAQSLDVVYSSHFVEHLHREDAQAFLRQCRVVLKPGGTLRTVVPDLAILARAYLESIPSEDNPPQSACLVHENAIQHLLEQLVREEPRGTAVQRGVLQRLERVYRGDARNAGEQHRWMYDRQSLGRTLRAAGFTDVREERSLTSRVGDWPDFALDVNPDGSAYIPNSLYLEASAPAS